MSSEIMIQGETNVNKFGCTLYNPKISDPLLVHSTWSNFSIQFDKLELTYEVRHFDCGMAAMTDDLREILKADNYPNLILKINQINVRRDSEGFEKLKVSADVDVTIGGVKRNMLIHQAYVINHSATDLTLHGEQPLRMTYFEIEPPTKFWGTVRVYDQIKIAFDIRMFVETK
ncbi:hypothetical protein [Marinoscillum sp. MHG1-6]|uniref:hypothetical protein n=1 Tax=Marinoscillum sp. MHG1-6 TaxID=2959627 RepID=UPI0021582D34|nr:hypothetical protein [Marinoscillum sp. MHG1-6]